jgi:hypothetical protein
MAADVNLAFNSLLSAASEEGGVAGRRFRKISKITRGKYL